MKATSSESTITARHSGVMTSFSAVVRPDNGPPDIITAGVLIKPPQCASTSEIFAPIGTSKFAGRATQSPSTVMTRDVRGIPVANALKMASEVCALKTTHPASSGVSSAPSALPISEYTIKLLCTLWILRAKLANFYHAAITDKLTQLFSAWLYLLTDGNDPGP